MPAPTRLTGGGGNNSLTGGGGNDTAVYATPLTLAALTFNGPAGWTVNGGATGGTDTLQGIEFIEHSGGRFVLIDPAGVNGFATVDLAVAAGAGTQLGDTFVFAAPPPPTDPIVVTLTTSQDLDFTIPYDNPTTVTITGTGTAHVTTGDGADFVVTGDGADFVVTGDGADTIHTGGGNDVVQAGPGDDNIVGGAGGGDDIYDGGDPGPNGNTVSYPSAINGITVDLNLADRIISRRSGEPRSAPCWAVPYHLTMGTRWSATRRVSTSAPTC